MTGLLSRSFTLGTTFLELQNVLEHLGQRQYTVITYTAVRIVYLQLEYTQTS